MDEISKEISKEDLGVYIPAVDEKNRKPTMDG